MPSEVRPRPSLLFLAAALAACGGAAGGPDTAVHPPPAPQPAQVCGVDGFCWMSPLPTGAQINALSGFAWNDVWAGTADGVLHFDGIAWASAALPGGAVKVRSLWGSGSADLWAAGDALLHWDGKAWSPATGLPHPDASFLSVTGAGPNEVWALEDAGDATEERHSILRWDGAAFTVQYGPVMPTLSALGAAGPGAAWAVGLDVASMSGLVLRLAAGAWTPVTVPPGDGLVAVWAPSPTEVWAAGGETLLHFDGASWSSSSASQAAPLRGLHGTGPDDVWAVGTAAVLHYDGQRWSDAYDNQSAQRLVRAVYSSGTRNTWAAGDSGLLLHHDGTAWSPYQQGSIEYRTAAFAFSPTDAWAVGGHGVVQHFDGAAWSIVSVPTPEALSGVWGADPKSVFVAGASGDCNGFVLAWNGATWSQLLPPRPGTCLTGIHGTAANDLWAVGLGALLHWDGGQWLPTGPADVGGAVWANGGSDVWVLQQAPPSGMAGGVYHYDGMNWTLTSPGLSAPIRALWGSGGADVWAAGDDATTVAHWTGGGWAPVPTGISDAGARLSALWGTGPADVWLAGSGAPVVHWTGSAFSSPDGAELRNVSGLAGAGTTVFAAGDEGAILRRAR